MQAGDEPATDAADPHDGDGDDDDRAGPSEESKAAWSDWLLSEIRQSAAHAEHGALLERCCAIAAEWRSRFWDRRSLWTRIRRGRRLVKELLEAAPVLARACAQVEALQLTADQPRLVIIDLCSGFGYLGMFLSELLQPMAHKVEAIVLVDRMWAKKNVARQAHHLSPEHLEDPAWPVRLTTSRADLKVPSDRRSLVRAFLSHGAPAMLLGVHLCGLLSLRCVELFNACPAFCSLALKPCCLPPVFFAKRGDVFAASERGHAFPAAAVCVAGQWRRGQWVGSAGKEECQRKYVDWVDNLSLCVECGEQAEAGDDEESQGGGGRGGGGPSGEEAPRASGQGATVECHPEAHPVLDRFIFASRAWSAAPPTPATSNGCGVSEGRRRSVVAAWEAARRHDKHERRCARWSDDERAAHEARRRARETTVRVTLEPCSSGRPGARLRLAYEAHEGVFVPLLPG